MLKFYNLKKYFVFDNLFAELKNKILADMYFLSTFVKI